MALDLEELKRLHDKAYQSGQITRERAADDLVFYHITQWDDNLLEDSELSFRGQFDVLRKAGRQIMSDLATNPVQVDFIPVDESRDDGADLLDGLYRNDDRKNTSIEAYGMAAQDAVVCGFGAWELYADYATSRIGEKNQVIRRRFIPEACNTVMWDPNSKRIDRSDARYVSVLTAYSLDGYLDLAEDLTGERPDEGVVQASFKMPEQSYAFPWLGGDSKKIYVTSFYHKSKTKDKVLTIIDPLGMEQLLLESQLEDVMDELIDAGYSIVDERKIERDIVTKYIASGAEILAEDVIAGHHIPVVPVYGEYAIVEGEVHYEGITRLAKDPQRLRNFQMSYLADIVSRSPRPKPIFLPEQVQGFEQMYSATGAESNYPYLLQRFMDANGTQLPMGPVGMMPEQPIPQALMASIELTKGAVEDVANPGLPQDVADPDLSGKAVYALQNRMDQQSYIYQHNLKHAKRRDGEVYAAIAAEIYDAPREVSVTRPDGTTAKIKVMQSIIDAETGDIKTLNDLSNMEFEVFSDIQPSYTTKREQTVERYVEMATATAATDPNLSRALMLKVVELTDGANNQDIREYARKQLIIAGFKEPENEEELQMLEASQQQQQPDANMALAMAEQGKAQAQQMEAETKRMVAVSNIQNEQMKRQVDGFNAETKRMDTQIDAQEAGASIDYKRIDAMGKQLDNVMKSQEIASHPSQMSNEELFNQIRAGE